MQIPPSKILRIFLGIGLMALSLLMVGCRPTTTGSAKEKPAKVEKIEGSDLSKIVLTEKALERIDLKTVAVRSEKVVRTRKVGGEVIASTKAVATSSAKVTPASLRVKVSLSKGELGQINRSQPARVALLEQEDQEDQDDASAEWAEVEDGDDDGVALQYALKAGKQKLTAGQRVFVELPLSAAVERKVVPVSALVYDLKGDTWVYISQEPRSFMRHKVVVDYLDDETAVLVEGPEVGIPVVTDGVAQLYGTEFGVGK